MKWQGGNASSPALCFSSGEMFLNYTCPLTRAPGAAGDPGGWGALCVCLPLLPSGGGPSLMGRGSSATPVLVGEGKARGVGEDALGHVPAGSGAQ